MNTESYLKINLSRSERSFMAQFRCGILPLRIETGRFRNEDVSERLCVLCDSNTVEDEFHFLLQCPAYNAEIIILLNGVITSDFSNNSEIVICVMENKPRKMAKYIKSCYNFRRTKLYE